MFGHRDGDVDECISAKNREFYQIAALARDESINVERARHIGWIRNRYHAILHEFQVWISSGYGSALRLRYSAMVSIFWAGRDHF